MFGCFCTGRDPTDLAMSSELVEAYCLLGAACQVTVGKHKSAMAYSSLLHVDMHFSTFGAASIQVWNCPKPAKPVKLVWHMHSDHERTLRVSQDVSNTLETNTGINISLRSSQTFLAAQALHSTWEFSVFFQQLCWKQLLEEEELCCWATECFFFQQSYFTVRHTMFPTSSGNSGLRSIRPSFLNWDLLYTFPFFLLQCVGVAMHHSKMFWKKCSETYFIPFLFFCCNV